ncbi:MAG: hypothetical protein IJX80_07025 [Clostridia bacterium]|nr:hypothetical protein [Clostridia bacterium]
MKQHIIYRILTVLFGLCAVTLAVLTVISLIPSSDTGLTVKETLSVSSSPKDSSEMQYISQIQGVLINEGDEEIVVDALKIKVSDGRIEREMLLEGFSLPARVSYNILYEWQDTHDYEQINAVTAVMNDTDAVLANATAGMPFNFSTLVYLVLCTVAVLLTVHFGKQCYYLIQEKQLKKEN